MDVKTDSVGNKYSVLFACSLMLTITYMALSSWGMAVPELSETFNLSNAMIQLGNAALIAGYAVGSFIEGRMLDKAGWKKTFAFAMVLFLLGSILIPFMKNYTIIVLLRFAMGFGLVVNITVALVGGWFPVHQRGLAVGILIGCIGLGSALGGYIAGVLTPKFGWENTFLILGGITVVGIIIFYILVKDPPKYMEESSQNESVAEEPQFTGNIYAQPALWLFALALLCVFFNVYGMYAFLATYLQSLEYTASEVGLVVLFNGLIAVLSTPVGGWFSDRMISKTGNVLKARAYSVGFVGALIGFIGCLLVPVLSPKGIGLAILAAVIAGWGCPATNSPILSLPSDIFGSKAAGPANGIVILIAGIGGIISPILIPYLADIYGWTFGWMITAIAAGVCFIVSMILPKFQKA
ncbi:MAG TPA: MFS transporter [Clostridia bacterium]|nr:MFS transporter [Clostridia bacterium]